MSFEPFVPVNKAVNTKNTYTIQAGTKKTGYFNGTVYFNGGMRDALNMTEYSYVELFTDKANKLIAIRLTNEQTDNTRALRKNGNHRFITCSSWLHLATSELGYPLRGSGSYEVIDGGLVVLKKPEAELTTPNPNERTSDGSH